MDHYQKIQEALVERGFEENHYRWAKRIDCSEAPVIIITVSYFEITIEWWKQAHTHGNLKVHDLEKLLDAIAKVEAVLELFR